jgi:hypothetical protein
MSMRTPPRVVAGLVMVALAASACEQVAPAVQQEPIWGSDPVRIDTVTLADDRHAVRVEFTGGKEFDPGDPCSVAYEGRVRVDGEELQIAVVAQAHPMPLAEGTGCDAIGYPRDLVIALEEPFAGTRIHDLAGYIILLEPPDELAELTALPAGWQLCDEGSLSESPTGRWSRTYAPAENGGCGKSRLELIQAFDGPAGVSGGELQPSVSINGTDATFYLWEPTGEMILVWSLGAHGVALVGNLADFSREEFIALAESVALPE